MAITWGHFSDLHFKDWGGFDTETLRQKLLAKLEDEQIAFNYIFITGDILHQGVFDTGTKDFICDIARITKCDLKNIVICPGNHDARRFENRKLILDKLIGKRLKDPKVEMSDDDFDTLVTRSFSTFTDAHKTILGIEPESVLHYYRDLEGINLYVLNTSVFAGQTHPEQQYSSEGEKKAETMKENHNLYICDKTLSDLRNKAENQQTCLNIAIGHHGVDCFAEKEQERFKSFLDEINVDFYLCGHVHENTNQEILHTNHIRQISCGGLFSDGRAEVSFIVGEFESDGRIKLTSYAYNKKPAWAIHVEAKNPYNDGIYSHIIHRLAKKAEDFPPKYDEASLHKKASTLDGSSRIIAMKNEIDEVNEKFFGYSAELKKLKTYLQQSGYVYVHGQQLFGKTQLLLKAVYDISTEGAFNEEFSTHPLPWIHKCFIVIGKRALSREGGLKFLIEQANAVLSEPIKLKAGEYDAHGFSDILNKLSKVLERVVILFDALDEMGMDDLELFSEPLPKNCTVILSSKTKFLKAKNKLPDGTKVIELKGISEADILAMLGRKKSEQNVTAFVKFLAKETQGNPCFIRDVIDKVKDNNNTIPADFREAYKHITSPTAFFYRLRKSWVEGEGAEYRKELLKLFYIFERIDYLTLDDMQEYLCFIGKGIDSDDLVHCLGPIIHQLDTNDDGKYKLKYNAFVGYLIKKATRQDFQMAFNSVVDWLMQDKQHEKLALLFLNWNLFQEIEDAKVRVLAEKSNAILDFLNVEKELIDSPIIPIMYRGSERHQGFQKLFHPYILKCFALIENKDKFASEHFHYLYYTLNTETSREEAIQFIQPLADQGEQNALLAYADFLVKGNIYASANFSQAMHYYQRATPCAKSDIGLYFLFEMLNDRIAMQIQVDKLKDYDDHDEAQRIYAWHLAQGDICEKNIQKSSEIFDLLIEKQNIIAMEWKARLIAEMKFDNCKIEEAFELWDKVAEHSPEGYLGKGKYLYNEGNKEWLVLIEKAYREDLVDAVLFMAETKILNKENFDAKLIEKLDSIVEENRNAARLLYIGIKSHLIKEYKRFSMDVLYHFGFAYINKAERRMSGFMFHENGIYACAFREFEKGFIAGDEPSANNMAYMLRRGEATSDTHTVKSLLEPLLNQGSTLAQMNYALYIIQEAKDSQEFEEALGHIEQINSADSDYNSVVTWWQELADKSDCGEGELVLGLLLFAGKPVPGYGEKDMHTWLQKASAGGTSIADYILNEKLKFSP